jgi:hypothetical protein
LWDRGIWSFQEVPLEDATGPGISGILKIIKIKDKKNGITSF